MLSDGAGDHCCCGWPDLDCQYCGSSSADTPDSLTFTFAGVSACNTCTSYGGTTYKTDFALDGDYIVGNNGNISCAYVSSFNLSEVGYYGSGCLSVSALKLTLTASLSVTDLAIPPFTRSGKWTINGILIFVEGGKTFEVFRGTIIPSLRTAAFFDCSTWGTCDNEVTACGQTGTWTFPAINYGGSLMVVANP
ncbi:MAG: hypothetical protein IT446_14840 [Phycisphaerales bacterium]|nr:hypothetical protein [Phycisphaerales bacterium]